MANLSFIKVEVVYLTPNEQSVIHLELPENSTVIQAIELSTLLEKFPDIDLTRNKVGIFSKIVSLDTILHNGDRVEIYRPLLVDPKQKRRSRTTNPQPPCKNS